MIGSSRETVSRLFAGFQETAPDSADRLNLVIPNRVALESLITA